MTETQKHQIYRDVEQHGVGKVLALAHDTMGHTAPEAVRLLNVLAQKKAAAYPAGVRNSVCSALLSRWRSIISTSIQRVVAQSVLPGVLTIPLLPTVQPCDMCELLDANRIE